MILLPFCKMASEGQLCRARYEGGVKNRWDSRWAYGKLLRALRYVSSDLKQGDGQSYCCREVERSLWRPCRFY